MPINKCWIPLVSDGDVSLNKIDFLTGIELFKTTGKPNFDPARIPLSW